MSATRQAEAASRARAPLLVAVIAALFLAEGTLPSAMFSGSWNTALAILNMGLISAIMALGVNMIWGYAGLFQAGVVGFVALGGVAPVLIATSPVPGAWEAGLPRLIGALAFAVLALVLASRVWRSGRRGRGWLLVAILGVGFFVFRALFDPAVSAIEANNAAAAGNIGGLGWPVLLSWPVGAALAAAAAWAVGKVALGLRSDYLAIATLGIGEIIVAVLKNEDWIARGVKNMSGIPRPVPYELDLQQNPAFREAAERWGMPLAEASAVWVKLGYAALFTAVLLIIILLAELALNAPWGRMMRAIRDNEVAAGAMGKNVTARHLQIFVLGSAVIGLAGAMMVTFDGLLAPTAFNPLRYTFLVLVMVVVGGSGNNWGTVLGALLIWFLWIKVEVWGPLAMGLLTGLLPEGAARSHLLDASAHMRFIVMGVILLLVLRFAPRGLVPER